MKKVVDRNKNQAKDGFNKQGDTVMAYVSKEKSAKIKQRVKALCAANPGWKVTIAVRHHSTAVASIRAYPNFVHDDCIGKHGLYVNEYHIDTGFKGETLRFLKLLIDAMNLVGDPTDANFDKSDSQTDYFHVGHYTSINFIK